LDEGGASGEARLDLSTLQRLSDEADCRSVLMRYGPAVDWRDREALEALFWPDADVDLGFFRGRGSEAAVFLIENAGRSLRRCHITSSVNLRVDGDRAYAESCAVTRAVSLGAEYDLVSHLFVGRYLDRLDRRGGQWRLASRLYLLQSAVSEAYVEDPALAPLSKADGLSPAHPLFRRI